jgi:hypothetical protein
MEGKTLKPYVKPMLEEFELRSEERFAISNTNCGQPMGDIPQSNCFHGNQSENAGGKGHGKGHNK